MLGPRIFKSVSRQTGRRIGRGTQAVCDQVRALGQRTSAYSLRGTQLCQHSGFMAISDTNLLAEIQRDALDPAAGLSDTLRRVVALGGVVGSNELREWASLELRGYVGSPTELPAYRKVPATLEVNGFNGSMQVKGFRISPRALPSFAQTHVGEEVPLNSSVREIEEMARHADAKEGHVALSPPMAQDLARVMNSEGRAPIRVITELTGR
jgi:hypothetical protein